MLPVGKNETNEKINFSFQPLQSTLTNNNEGSGKELKFMKKPFMHFLMCFAS